MDSVGVGLLKVTAPECPLLSRTSCTWLPPLWKKMHAFSTSCFSCQLTCMVQT